MTCEVPRTLVWGWRGEASGIIHRMKQILETGERNDILFAVGRQYGEEQLFRAHKFVLCLGSDVFDTMFHGEVPETTEKIDLPDILPEAFGIMLKYLYTDVVEDLDLENVLPTLYCAKKYGIPKLDDICTKYAVNKVDKNTCFTLIEAAKPLDAQDLLSKCLEIVDTNGSELLQSLEFLESKHATMQMILSRDSLFVQEDEIYDAAERWARNACWSNQLEPTAVNWRCVLGEALYCVRFPLMDDEQLANGPVASGLLLNEELRGIYQFKHAAKKPNIPFSAVPRSYHLVFGDRRWSVMLKPVGFWNMAARNVFLDNHGRLHLRLSQQHGVWTGGGVQLVGALGFGRYEFHIEGLARLDPNAGFALYSQAESEPGVAISTVGVESNGDSSRVLRYAIRPPGNFGPFCTRDITHFDVVNGVHAQATYSYHRKPDGVSFSSHVGHKRNNTPDEVSNWSYGSRLNISDKALPVFICLAHRHPFGDRPLDGTEWEIIVHSFRFYPDK